jgi:hypothetical protein
MLSKSLQFINTLLVLAVLTACSLAPAAPAQGQGASIPPTATPAPFVAETAGPAGFSATLAAPDIVQLTWQAVPDAVGYKLQIVPSGLDPLTIAYLPKKATRFKHYLAPESSLLTYRLQTVTASGPAGASSLQITTQGHASNPLTTQAVFADSGAASAVIGPTGGTLETTDARGVIYTLVIPPQALDTDLKITMTPVSTVGGWPLDGKFLGAVKLEPEGWLLNEVAFLTIRLPAAPKPGLSTVGFAFNGSGEEFHLTPANAGPSPIASSGTGGGHRASPVLRQDAGTFNLPVIQLRSSGVGAASAASAAALAEKNAPTGNSDAVDQKAAAAAATEDELAPLFTNAQLADVITGNLLTQVHFGVKDCYDFKRAVASFHSWDAEIAKLGDAGTYSNMRDGVINELAQKAVETIEKATDECVKADKGVVPASIPCAEKLTRDIQTAHTTGSNPFYSELSDAITKDPALKGRFTAADPNHTSVQCPHSFGVNEAASLDYHWTSSCIPSLDRPYQVAWVGPALNGIYRLYPNDPFSGRMDGQSITNVGGATISIVYEGTYTIETLQTDSRGYPLGLDAHLTYKQTITACAGGICNTATEDGKHQIPLIVHSDRCPIP